MKTNLSIILAGAGLTLAAPGHREAALFKRTGYDLCETDCTLAGVAFPDKHTLQLMLENNWSEQCPPIYIGDPNNPTATSKVCLDFVGTYVYFNFSSFPGYNYQNARVTWGLMGNLLDSNSWNPPPPASSITCGPNPSGDGLACKLPFSDILGAPSTSSAKDLLAGMCPNGDREGLGLYLAFSGLVQSTADSTVTASFSQSPPCTARDSTGACTARDISYSYIEVAYRCSTCTYAPACPPPLSTTTTSSTTTSSTTSSTTTSAPPPSQTNSCSVGTAFGYQNPVGNTQKSFPLDTQPGQGCMRWGWYETPSLAELQSGISGPLYVGAGNNDISKATLVGTWTATADAGGKATVTYLLNPPYAVAEVHVDLACLPIDKCAPGQYTFGQSGLGDASTFATPPLQYPTCGGGSEAALIVHAAVDKATTAATC